MTTLIEDGSLVLFQGDSITDAGRSREDDSALGNGYAAMAAAWFSALYPEKNVRFINRGISGQITSQMLARFTQDVVELKPQIVVIWGGTNDIARAVDPAVIQRNITAMCDLAEFHRIKVVLASITPVNDHHKAVNPAYERTIQRPPSAIIAMNSWLQKLAATRGFVYADYYQATLATDTRLAANLTPDGLHLNADGYRLISPVLLAALEKAQNPAQPPAKKRRLF